MRIGYLRSCLSETVKGGIVTIGETSSTVSRGGVSRQTVQCDGGRLRLTDAQSSSSGVVVLRGRAASPGPATITLFSPSPAFSTLPGGRLLVERIDAPEPSVELTVLPTRRGQAGFVDLAPARQVLTAGGLYRVSGPSGEARFRIDPSASARDGALVGRLVRF